jgi:hypothetical protein
MIDRASGQRQQQQQQLLLLLPLPLPLPLPLLRRLLSTLIAVKAFIGQ